MQVGDVFADTYRIDGEIARGGMGVVYRAFDLGLERPVALKLMAASVSRDDVFRARFRREASMAARIDHPHVVPVFHRGEHEGVLYVVMRLVEGVDLAEVLGREGPLELGRTAQLVSQVAAALDAAHQLGLVHRDVKPGNILLQHDDRALLTDFGLARQVSGGTDLTSVDTLMGTAAYLAPEQALGRAVDGRCDVYALGCVAFHCLTGRTPYPEGAAITVAAAQVHEPVPDLRAVAPHLPARVGRAVSRALAKDPADRWPTAGAFAAALAQAGEAVTRTTTAPLPAVPSPRRSRRRRTALWMAVFAVPVAAVAVLVAVLANGPDGQGAARRPDPHDALVARLPASVYTRCRPAPAREVKGVVTAVDCAAVVPGADEVLVSQFAGPAAMSTDWDAHYRQRLSDGMCRESREVRSTWEEGRLACYPNAAGAAVLLYEYDKTGLQVLAVRRDGKWAELYDWWHAQRKTPVG